MVDGFLDKFFVAAECMEVADGVGKVVAEDLLDTFLYAEDVVVAVAVVFSPKAYVTLPAVDGVVFAEVV